MGAQVPHSCSGRLPVISLNILHCIQFAGAHEGNECKDHDKGCHCRSTLHQHGDQEESVRTDDQQPCRNCHAGSEEHGSVHHPWCLQDQNCMKPATKAGKREVFGKVVMVKAKPARKVVKAFPVSALKQSVRGGWKVKDVTRALVGSPTCSMWSG